MKTNDFNPKKSKWSFFRLETMYLWIFPIMAIVFSTWAVTKYLDTEGKRIEIHFSEASSIVSGKTRILFRGVQIGMVEDIAITKDGKKVICEVELTKSGEKFAVAGSKFYLVTPKVGFDQISGLDTIISGSYIVIEPNLNSSESQDIFEGDSNYNPSVATENMVNYFLVTDNAESVSSGDNLYYRGIVVGNIGSVDLSPDSRKVIISAYVFKKFVKIIRTNTVFWKKQGIKADLGLFDSDVKVSSFDTIMKGGVELATPNKAGRIAKAKTRFMLLDNEPEEREDEKWEPKLKFQKKQKRLAGSN